MSHSRSPHPVGASASSRAATSIGSSWNWFRDFSSRGMGVTRNREKWAKSLRATEWKTRWVTGSTTLLDEGMSIPRQQTAAVFSDSFPRPSSSDTIGTHASQCGYGPGSNSSIWSTTAHDRAMRCSRSSRWSICAAECAYRIGMDKGSMWPPRACSGFPSVSPPETPL